MVQRAMAAYLVSSAGTLDNRCIVPGVAKRSFSYVVTGWRILTCMCKNAQKMQRQSKMAELW